MPSALAIVSFICTALLAVLLPVKRIWTSVPNFAIVLWLCGYNLVHGINAVVWDGNVGNHAPVWCYIVTKLMLGANIALPGAFLCIARNLEHLSSSRRYSLEKHTRRNRTILEMVLCYVIPLIYMLLHLVAQDHRFDLVEGYGCSASIHPSLFPFFLIWIPPLVLCSISLLFCIFTTSHVFRFSPDQLALHLESRTTATSSIFNRRLAVCMLTTAAILFVRIFSIFLNPEFVPWVSWSSAHAQFAQVEVVTSSTGVRAVRFDWWGIFAVSVVFIGLSYLLGEETRDVMKWIQVQWTRERRPPSLRKLVLPLHNPRRLSTPEMSMPSPSRSASLSKPKTRPLTLELRSGWDDMLDIKTPKSTRSFKGIMSPRTPSPTSTSPTSRLSPQPPLEEGRSRASSRASFIDGPVAQMPVATLPPVAAPFVRPPRPNIDIPPLPTSPPPLPPVALSRNSSRDRSRSPRFPASPPAPPTKEDLTPVLDASWPLPPTSPVPSLIPSRHTPRTRSRSGSTTSRSGSVSPVSSEGGHSSFGYPLYPTVTPPHLRTRPFEGSSISSMSDIGHTNTPQPVIKPLKSILKKPSVKSLRRSWSQESVGRLHGQTAEVIHMTVVQEIV